MGKRKWFQKEKGQAWIGGVYIILLVLVLFFIIIQKQKFDIVVEDTQDTLVSSALGSLLVDYRELSFTNDIVLENVDASYAKLLSLIEANTGMTRKNCEYTGENPHYATAGGKKCRVENVIFYDVRKSTNTVTSYNYRTNTSGVPTKTVETKSVGSVVTPTNEKVEKTSCYLSFSFPVEVCGITRMASKGCYVVVDSDETSLVAAGETTYEELDNATHTHNYTRIVNVEPTCETPGKISNICSCGESQVEEVEALGHDEGDKSIMTEIVLSNSTCTEKGKTERTYYCIRCKNPVSKVVVEYNKLLHTASATIIENRKEPTCQEKGHYDNVVYCSICGTQMSRTTVPVPMISHVAGKITEENIKNATCTGNGQYDKVTRCKFCDTVLDRESPIIIPALGHNIEHYSYVVNPTCTLAGARTDVTLCNRCEYYEDTVTIIPAGHVDGDVFYDNVIEPTCKTTGSRDKITCCMKCGLEIRNEHEILPVIPHVFVETSEITKEPTCYQAGEMITVFKCELCGDEDASTKKTITFDKMEHDYVAENVEVIAPDLANNKSGYTRHKCYWFDTCGAYYDDAFKVPLTVKISVDGNVYANVGEYSGFTFDLKIGTAAATTMPPSTMVSTGVVYNAVLDEGTTWTVTHKTAKPGYSVSYSLSTNTGTLGKVYDGVVEEVKYTHTHTYTTDSTYTVDSGVRYLYATCTAPQYNYRRCQYCGYNPKSTSLIIANGNSLGHTGNSAYYHADSKCYKTCTRVNANTNVVCGAHYGEVSYTEQYGGTSAVHTKCSNCGNTLSSTHSYTVDSGVKYKDADCTNPQKNYKRCACGYNPKSADYIVDNGDALGHSWSTTYTSNTTQHWKTCTRSGCTATDSSANHSYDTDSGVKYSDATCTNPQYNYKKCGTCGYNPKSSSYIVAYGDMLGHSSNGQNYHTLEDFSWDATTPNGYSYSSYDGMCTRCGYYSGTYTYYYYSGSNNRISIQGWHNLSSYDVHSGPFAGYYTEFVNDSGSKESANGTHHKVSYCNMCKTVWSESPVVNCTYNDTATTVCTVVEQAKVTAGNGIGSTGEFLFHIEVPSRQEITIGYTENKNETSYLYIYRDNWDELVSEKAAESEYFCTVGTTHHYRMYVTLDAGEYFLRIPVSGTPGTGWIMTSCYKCQYCDGYYRASNGGAAPTLTKYQTSENIFTSPSAGTGSRYNVGTSSNPLIAKAYYTYGLPSGAPSSFDTKYFWWNFRLTNESIIPTGSVKYLVWFQPNTQTPTVYGTGTLWGVTKDSNGKISWVLNHYSGGSSTGTTYVSADSWTHVDADGLGISYPYGSSYVGNAYYSFVRVGGNSTDLKISLSDEYILYDSSHVIRTKKEK